MRIKSAILSCEAIETITAHISHAQYRGNVYAVTRDDGVKRNDVRHMRFTLETQDAYAYGSRQAGSGRHMRKASWQAHREVLRALFNTDPDAIVQSALATYRGRADFLANFEATGLHNCGSRSAPIAIRNCAV